MYEDELIPHFENCGKIWDLRLMMDPMSGLNRLVRPQHRLQRHEVLIRVNNTLNQLS